jgi:hypothetical protein
MNLVDLGFSLASLFRRMASKSKIMESPPPPRDQMHSLSPAEVLDRIATLSAMLHEEQGNREELQRQRAELMQEARRRGLLQSKSSANS